MGLLDYLESDELPHRTVTAVRHLLYIVGGPGSGKTTLVRTALADRKFEVRQQPFAHMIYGPGRVQLGGDRPVFGGTDALSMSVQPRVLAALSDPALDWQYVLAEGDRLANGKFFSALHTMPDWDLTVVWLRTPEKMAAERRLQRAGSTQATQDAKWVEGRETKARRLGQSYADVVLDGALSPNKLAAALWGQPVIQALRGER